MDKAWKTFWTNSEQGVNKLAVHLLAANRYLMCETTQSGGRKGTLTSTTRMRRLVLRAVAVVAASHIARDRVDVGDRRERGGNACALPGPRAVPAQAVLQTASFARIDTRRRAALSVSL